MSLLDRLEVPLAQSRASTIAVVSPRVTASRASGPHDAAADDQNVYFVLGHPGDRVLPRRGGQLRRASTVPLPRDQPTSTQLSVRSTAFFQPA